jgi:hypothetical protein
MSIEELNAFASEKGLDLDSIEYNKEDRDEVIQAVDLAIDVKIAQEEGDGHG